MKIIMATGNANKVKEIRQMLEGSDIEVLSLKDVQIDAEIDENGTTFEENAAIKAETICKLTGQMVMADDSGLEIDALGGEPGIHSSRFMGEDTSYEVKNQNLLDRLAGVAKDKRTARFVCAIAVVMPGGENFTCTGTIEGYIGEEPMGENGCGYDPIFYVDPQGVSTAALTPEEKNAISHRGKAMRAMREELVKRLGDMS